MDAASAVYIETILAIVVVAIVALTLFSLSRRMRKEETFVGFQGKSKAETYAGYSLFTTGMIITLYSIYGVLALLTSNLPTKPFGLSAIIVSVNGQASVLASSQVLSLVLGTAFWLLLILFGGRKIAAVGLDLLKGRKVKLRSYYRASEVENKAENNAKPSRQVPN